MNAESLSPLALRCLSLAAGGWLCVASAEGEEAMGGGTAEKAPSRREPGLPPARTRLAPITWCLAARECAPGCTSSPASSSSAAAAAPSADAATAKASDAASAAATAAAASADEGFRRKEILRLRASAASLAACRRARRSSSVRTIARAVLRAVQSMARWSARSSESAPSHRLRHPCSCFAPSLSASTAFLRAASPTSLGSSAAQVRLLTWSSAAAESSAPPPPPPPPPPPMPPPMPPSVPASAALFSFCRSSTTCLNISNTESSPPSSESAARLSSCPCGA